MLSTLILGSSDAECTTGSYPRSFVLREAPRRLEDIHSHTKKDDGNSGALGPAPGYRQLKAVKPYAAQSSISAASSFSRAATKRFSSLFFTVIVFQFF